MRIIRGKYKGKRFSPPKKFPSRPTTDMAKEALFSILDARMYFERLEILDLFSGTGNISLEFLSRGVGKVVSVDQHPVSYKFQQKIAHEIDDVNWSIIRKNALEFLAETPLKFDVIFADPPFDFDNLQEICETVFERELLLEDGVLVIEHSDRKSLKKLPNFKREKSYGGVAFSFFEKE